MAQGTEFLSVRVVHVKKDCSTYEGHGRMKYPTMKLCNLVKTTIGPGLDISTSKHCTRYANAQNHAERSFLHKFMLSSYSPKIILCQESLG